MHTNTLAFQQRANKTFQLYVCGFFCVCFPVFVISFHVCCVFVSVVGLDIQDEMGRHEVGHIDNSMKIPLSQGEGCRFEGEFTINKVRRHHPAERRKTKPLPALCINK